MRLALSVSLLAMAVPARAELPAPVRAMIDAAIATGDEAKVKTVIDLAKQTNPSETAAIDTLGEAFFAGKREEKRLAEAKRLEAIRSAGVLETGRRAVGGFAAGTTTISGWAPARLKRRDRVDPRPAPRAIPTLNWVTSRENISRYERANRSATTCSPCLGPFESDVFRGSTPASAVGGSIPSVALRPQPRLKAGPALRRTDSRARPTPACRLARRRLRGPSPMGWSPDTNLCRNGGARVSLIRATHLARTGWRRAHGR